ncbi:hypothetical protein ACFW9F_02735 [Streptomyces sp. NPDC059506]|uniref:hypothetical protein n=1 Tax=Streptomyces sp. NPDC059506 TaxID=3347751 RepID=UPI0036B9F9E2
MDTDVLFPFSVMDVMPALTEDSVHEVVWSERLLAERERVIVREGRRSAQSAASVRRSGVASMGFPRHVPDLVPSRSGRVLAGALVDNIVR